MPYRQQLKDMGYKQRMFPNGSTLITTDNQCAKNVKLKRAEAIDMRYHWIRDRVQQGDFTVEWRSNKQSLADFFTKTLPTTEHLSMRNKFVTMGPRTTPNYRTKTRTQ
jgi:hypothetical protein